MNVERDSDRQLRTWMSEGVDRAPERFVWAALDEIERLPQRGPYRADLESVVTRLRPAAAVLGVAATVVVAVIVALQLTLPNRDVGGPRRPFELADLEGIVVWENTKPTTWVLENLVSNPHDILEIPIRSMTQAEMDNLANPPGYIGGRYTNFSRYEGSSAVALFMSWSTVFATNATAQSALPFFVNELESPQGWGYGPGEPVALGDGGYRYTGLTTSFNGPPGSGDPVPSNVYLWRDGNVLLAVGGWWEFDADELRAVAEGMDARAAALARDER